MMIKKEKTLQRSISRGCLMLITVLCLLLGLVNYREYKTALYRRYEAYITDLLLFTAENIDVDDLESCVESGVKSEKYEQLQALIDQLKDTHKIDFLYVIIPQHPGEHDNIMNVIAAMSSYEKVYEPENEVELGELTGDSYPAETAAKYYGAINNSGQITFFEEVAEWGDDYTGVLPLVDSRGEFFAELCVDVPVQELHDIVRNHMAVNIALIVGIGLLFMTGFMLWSNKSIVTPIKKLEKSVVDFASQSHGKRELSELTMTDPKIDTNDELESLTNAVLQMADDIRDYVTDVVAAEREAERMRELANKDALTSVKNKGAYVTYISQLEKELEEGKPLEFAILIFDCDNLKEINDQFGHDRGDEYLKAASRLICRIFKHSPVFRIGGDEFSVCLRGEDYQNREALIEKFREERERICQNEENCWDQVRVSMGMAVYDPGADSAVTDTMRRADKNMYQNKARLKS